MTRRARIFWNISGIVLLLLVAAHGASAADHFLTFGGGSSASNNQVSLEQNVLFLQSFLAEPKLARIPHEIFFANGDTSVRDIQYVDPNAPTPRANELLAEVLDSGYLLTAQFRAHAIQHLTGASQRAPLRQWFENVGSHLPDGDRLFIYYTGHGGRGTQANTTLAMWKEDDMPVREFAALLDRLPPKVPVVLVMVQCFSGGFANVLYNGGDPSKGLSDRNRCGFYATVSDRVAAGCTSDVDADDYHEYSTYFWAALSGHTRTGHVVAPPDYDGDGAVSFAEAHAYTLIHSDTIDIPNKTSDALLRQFSKLKAEAGAGLISADGNFSQILERATPADREVLQALAAQVRLGGPETISAARKMADDLRKQRQGVEGRRAKLKSLRERNRHALESVVYERWPELRNLLHPVAARIIGRDGDAIVNAVETTPQFKEFKRESSQTDALEDEAFALEKSWVKCQRLIRTAESVALAANLPKVSSPQILERYNQLAAAEAAVLVAAK